MPAEVLQVLVLNLIALTGFAIWLITAESNLDKKIKALGETRESG